MRTPTALLILLIGLAVTLTGVGLALRELIGLYAAMLDSPLDQPEGFEAHVSRAMLTGVLIGACGLPILLTGSVLLAGARRRARLARLKSRSARRRA